jgi:hypothetical protein
MQANAILAKRASGAMFLTFFGSAWMLFGAMHAYPSTWLPALLALCAGSVIFLAAYQVYRSNRRAIEPENQDSKKISNRFHLINCAQWLMAIVAANVLINLGKPEWVVVAVMFIVGLHFVPLAHLFRHQPHYILAVALMGWALIYPLCLSQGPANPLGSLGAGLILWSAALNSLRKGWQR